jgi:ATP-binding cassette subfamily G (WHITE) protein 2 (SNQ2)
MSGAHHPSTAAASSVNIVQAENAFHELSRQLSQGTFVNDQDHGVAHSRSRTSIDSRAGKDLEKAAVSHSEEPFDLREYLTSSNDANQRAGIKHKHVGVTWEDFHVDVLGGSNFKVSWKRIDEPSRSLTRCIRENSSMCQPLEVSQSVS